MSKSFLKYIKNGKSSWLRANFPNSYLVLSVIAERARRESGFDDGLQIGDAIIAYEELGNACGLTKKETRTAVKKLFELSQVKLIWNGKNFFNCEKRSFKRAHNCLVVNLISSDIWDINCDEILDERAHERAQRGHTQGTKQEGKRRNKEKKSLSAFEEEDILNEKYLNIFYQDPMFQWMKNENKKIYVKNFGRHIVEATLQEFKRKFPEVLTGCAPAGDPCPTNLFYNLCRKKFNKEITQ